MLDSRLALDHCRDRFLSIAVHVVAGSLGRFSQVVPYSGMRHIRHVPDLDMAHLFACAFEEAVRISQLGSPMETEVHIAFLHADVADAVLDNPFGCRPAELYAVYEGVPGAGRGDHTLNGPSTRSI